MILLDANVLVYYLDETSTYHKETISSLQELIDSDEQLVTSHHIIEEVLFIVSKLSSEADITKAVTRIAALPGLILVEPSPSVDFAKRYARLSKRLHMGINDALLLQLMIDAGITRLFTFDKQFMSKASALGIKQIVEH